MLSTVFGIFIQVGIPKGSFINDVTVLDGGFSGFCDDSSKALVIKLDGGRGVQKLSKIRWCHLWTTPIGDPTNNNGPMFLLFASNNNLKIKTAVSKTKKCFIGVILLSYQAYSVVFHFQEIIFWLKLEKMSAKKIVQNLIRIWFNKNTFHQNILKNIFEN